MNRTSIIASAAAALSGVVVALALALVSGAAVTQTSPTTEITDVAENKGVIPGSSSYGERDDSGANK